MACVPVILQQSLCSLPLQDFFFFNESNILSHPVYVHNL